MLVEISFGITIILLLLFFAGKRKSSSPKSLLGAVAFAMAVALSLFTNVKEGDFKYLTIGLMMSCLMLYLEKTCKEMKYYYVILVIAILGMMAVCGRRLGALVVACFGTAYIAEKVFFLLVKRGKGFIVAFITLVVAIGVWWFRNEHLCIDGFRRDVLNTYVASVFTSRRYSFEFIFSFPVAYVIIVSTLVYLLICKGVERTISMEFNIINLGSIIFIAALGVLYVVKFAYDNILQGEYLTDFEHYMQIPFVVTLVFWMRIIIFKLGVKDKEE